MEDINDLDEKLNKSINSFGEQMQLNMNKLNQTRDNEYVTRDDMDEIQQQIFYVFKDFQENIISYLKINNCK